MRVRNVCEALPRGIRYLQECGTVQDSRAGRVVVAPDPVTTVYHRPWEKVLSSPVRDANPFFHLLESAWMLAGEDDAVFLNEYVSDFGARFAEDNGHLHGAYGMRWRGHFGMSSIDQIQIAVDMLRSDPGTRRVAIAMWDPECDLGAAVRDVPCNTHVYLRARKRELFLDEPKLDLTVCCRSNDAVWGAHGANAVHFAFLLECVAGLADMRVGTMTQISNDYHAYADFLMTMRGRGEKLPQGASISTNFSNMLVGDHYSDGDVDVYPLVTDPGSFWADLRELISAVRALHAARLSGPTTPEFECSNGFLSQTIWRAALAHRYWRCGEPIMARGAAALVAAPDWRAACGQWLARRHVGVPVDGQGRPA